MADPRIDYQNIMNKILFIESIGGLDKVDSIYEKLLRPDELYKH